MIKIIKICIPSEIRSSAINDTFVILVHLEEGTVLAPRLPKL